MLEKTLRSGFLRNSLRADQLDSDADCEQMSELSEPDRGSHAHFNSQTKSSKGQSNGPRFRANSKIVQEIFGSHLDLLHRLNFEGNLDIRHDVQFEQPFEIRIRGELCLHPCTTLKGLRGLSLIAWKVNVSAARVLSDQSVQITSSEIINSDGGLVDAQSRVCLMSQEIDNRKGTIISREEDILWLADELGVFDNSSGRLRAQTGVRLRARSDREKEQPVFLNDGGLIEVARGSLKANLTHFCNALGLSKATCIKVRADSIENSRGILLAKEKIRLQLDRFIDNFRGEIQGALIEIQAQGDVRNQLGLMSAIGDIRISAGIFSSENPDTTGLKKLLRGKIFSKQGSIYLASRYPLILSDHLTAGRGVEIDSEKDILNLAGFKCSASSGYVRVRSDEGQIQLTDFQLAAREVDLKAQTGPVQLENADIRADLTVKSNKGVLLRKLRVKSLDQGVRIFTNQTADIRILSSHLNGTGTLILRQSSGKELRPQVRIENSQIDLQALQITGEKTVILKSAFLLNDDLKVDCEHFDCNDVKIRNKGHLRLHALSTLKAVSLFASSHNIRMHAQNVMYHSQCKYISKKSLSLIVSDKSLFFRGGVFAGKNFCASSPSIIFQDFVAWTGRDFNVRGSHRLNCNNINVFAHGSQLALTGVETSEINKATLSAPYGNIATISFGELNLEQVAALSATHEARGQVMRGRLIHQLAYENIELIAQRLKLCQSVLEIKTINVARAALRSPNSPDFNAISLQGDEYIALQSCHLNSPIGNLQTQSLEIENSHFQHSALHVDAARTACLEGNYIEAGSADLRTTDLHGDQQVFEVKDLTLIGDDLFLNNSSLKGDSLRARAATVLQISDSQMKHDQLALAGDYSAKIANVQLTAASNLEFIAPHLHVEVLHLQTRRAFLMGRSTLIAKKLSVKTADWQVKGGDQRLESTALMGKVSGLLQARQVKGSKVILSVQRGDVHLDVEFARFEDLLLVAGGQATLRADVLRAEVGELRVGQNLSIIARAHLAFQNVDLQTNSADLQSDHMVVADSALRARRSLKLGGVRGSSQNSHFEVGGELSVLFSRLKLHQSVLSGQRLRMQSRYLAASQSDLTGVKSLQLSAPFQYLMRCSLKTDRWLRQEGWILLGFSNTLTAGAVVQSAMAALLSHGDQVGAHGMSRLAPFSARSGNCDSAAVLIDLALSALGTYNSQKGLAALGLNLTSDQNRSSIDVKFLRRKVLWRLRESESHFDVQTGRLESDGHLILRNASGQADEFSARASESLDARGSKWQRGALDLRAERIEQRDAIIFSQKSRIAAGHSIDNRSAVLGGASHLSAPVISQRGGLVSCGDATLATSDLQTDKSTELEGPGRLQLQIANDELRGSSSAQELAVCAQSDNFENRLDVQGGNARFEISGAGRNRASLGGISAQFQTGGELRNAGPIASERVDVDTQKLIQEPGSEIAANQFVYHQKEPLTRSELGDLSKVANATFSSDGSITVDQAPDRPGSVGYFSKNQADRVRVLVPLDTAGDVALSGSGVDLSKSLQVGGKFFLRFKEDLTGDSDITVHNGADMEGKTLDNSGRNFQIRGDTRFVVQNFYNAPQIHLQRERYVHRVEWRVAGFGRVSESDPNWPLRKRRGFLAFKGRSYLEKEIYTPHISESSATSGGKFEVDGKLDMHVGNSMQNSGGEFSVRGDTRLVVQNFQNISPIYLSSQTSPERKRRFKFLPFLFEKKELCTPPPSESLPTIKGKFEVDGNLDLHVGDSGTNSGSEFSVSGNFNHTGKPIDNLNCRHSYSQKECVGYRQRRFCGFKVEKLFEHVERDYTVIDAVARMNIGGNYQFQLTDTARNQGTIRAGAVSGRVGNLANDPEVGGNISFGGSQPPQLPLGSIHAENDLSIYVDGHTLDRGRITSGGNFGFSTNTLDSRPSTTSQPTPLFKRSGAFGTDSMTWQDRQEVGDGGVMRAGGSSHIQVREGGSVRGAHIHADGDLLLESKNLDIDCLEDQRRADLPGRTSAFKTKELHAIHTQFRRAQITAGGRLFVPVENLMKSRGALIHGEKGTFLRQGHLIESVALAVNKVEQSSGWSRTTDRSEGVSCEPIAASATGNVESYAEFAARFAGCKIAPSGYFNLHGGSVEFDTYFQIIGQQERTQKFSDSNLSWANRSFEQLHAVQPQLICRGFRVTSDSTIRGRGLQLQTVEGGVFDAPSVEMLPQHFTLRSEVRGGSIGISNPGLQALKKLEQGQSPEEFAKDLLLRDPAISKVHALVNSECGEEAALNGLSTAIQIWKDSNALSASEGDLTRLMGERLGILNRQGEFAPKITAYLQLFTASEEVRDALPCQFSGRQIVIRADEQRLQGVDFGSSQIAHVGRSRKANVRYESYAQERHFSSETGGVSISYNGNWEFGANFAEGESSQIRQRNSQVGADNIHWDAADVDVAGANISSATMTGEIDKLRVESRYDTYWKRGRSFAGDTSGNLHVGRPSIDRSTIQQSTFEARKPSSLRVKEMVIVGAATRNIQAARVRGQDLREFYRDRSWQVNLNTAEMARFGKSIGLSPKSPQSSSPASRDPRKMQGFFELGTLGWRRENSSRPVRATAAGALNSGGLNRDWSKRFGEVQTSLSKGTLPLAIPNLEVLSAQRQHMLAGSQQSASAQTAQPPKKSLDEIAQDIDKIDQERKREPATRSSGALAEQEAELARYEAKGKRQVAEVETSADQAPLGASSISSSRGARRMGRNGLLREVVRSRLEHERKCRELEEAEARRNRSLENRWNPEAPQTVDVKLRHGFALLEERRARTTHSRNSYKLCQDEIDYTRDPARLRELVSEQREHKAAMLKAQSDINSLEGVFDIELQSGRLMLFDNLNQRFQTADKSQIQELDSQMLSSIKELRRVSDRKRAAQLVAARESYFKKVKNGEEFEVFCQLNPETVQKINSQLMQLSSSEKSHDADRKFQSVNGASASTGRQFSSPCGIKATDREFSNIIARQIASNTSTSSELVQHLMIQHSEFISRYERLSGPEFVELNIQLNPSNLEVAHRGMSILMNMPEQQADLITYWYASGYTHMNENNRPVDMNYCRDCPEKGGVFLYAEGKSSEEAVQELLTQETMITVMVNGINCTREEFFENLGYTSRIHEGRATVGIFNPTTGNLARDIEGCAKNLSGIWTETTLRLDATLRKLHDDKPDRYIYLTAHSGGTVHCYLVVSDMDRETRKKYFYLGANPAKHMPEELIEHAVNIIGDRDGVVDNLFLKDSRNEVIKSLIKEGRDHYYNSKTLEEPKKDHAKACWEMAKR